MRKRVYSRIHGNFIRKTFRIFCVKERNVCKRLLNGAVFCSLIMECKHRILSSFTSRSRCCGNLRNWNMSVCSVLHKHICAHFWIGNQISCAFGCVHGRTSAYTDYKIRFFRYAQFSRFFERLKRGIFLNLIKYGISYTYGIERVSYVI